MYFFVDFDSVEPFLVSDIFENIFETMAKHSECIVGHVYYQTENISQYQNFPSTNQGHTVP